MSEEQRIDKSIDIDNTFALESKSKSPIDIDKNILQDIIGTVGQSRNLTQSDDNKGDQDAVEKTNEDDNAEQINSKTSRELKLLLALSKEANLDTNILHKRKTLEGIKSKDKESSPKIKSLDSDTKKIPKVANENRNFRYPVTAESELELDIHENEVNKVKDNSNKTSKRKRDSLSEVNIGGATEENTKRNRKSFSDEMFKPNKDMFCWRCHREGVNIACETCPRSYHQRCLKQTISDAAHWPCPECVSILKAESTQTRSEAMKGMTLEHLCSLLKFAVNRMIQCQGSEPFLHPVSDNEFPDYKKYIIQPMDLTKIEKNIKENLYGSTQAFEADAKWLLHNSIIFNSYQSKLTSSAKNIIRICKQEMAEIENCPSCYLNANTKKGTWFVEVCPKPHLLVWAKLKGFPFWPAKAMCTNSSGMVDVRFFGAHDRAWVHFKDCYLFSEKDPNTFKQKRYDIEKCVEELNIYIKNLQKVYGEFKYAPYKTVLDPNNEFKQLQIFLPKYKTYLSTKKKIKHKSDIETKVEVKEDKKEIDTESPTDEKKEVTEKSDSIITNTITVALNPLQLNDMHKIKINVPETEPDKSTEKQNRQDIKTNGLSPSKPLFSPSKFHDNDVTMEGYGTDDDTIPEIDLECRKKFIEKKAGDVSENTNRVEEEEEEEEDNDTQVPSNISVENAVVKGNVRTQGSLSGFSDKIKILPRRTSEPDTIQKRQSTEEIPHSPQKLSRRNSDQSVKSDSSRMSNISDKINRVDISENMEITLGNDDIGCISISENISSNHSESSKSGSDYSLDNKRRPVQVDIENAEFTISPSNKLKISDKLIKRLSDGCENITNSTKVEEVTKAIVEKKSPTDILIEKFKGVVEHEVVDFSQPSTSSLKTDNNCNLNNKSSEISTTTDIPEKVTDDNETIVKSVHLIEKTLNTKSISPPSEPSEDMTRTEKTVHPLNSPKSTNTAEDSKADVQNDELNVENILSMSDQNIDIKHVEENIEDENSEEFSDSNSQANEVINEKESSLEVQSSEQVPKKQTALIQPSITEFTTSSLDRQINNNEKRISNDITNIAIENLSNATNSEIMSNNANSKTPINSEVMNIIEEFEDGEEMEILDDIEIDKNKIFNIIHSSLNATKKKDSNKKHEFIKEKTVPTSSESAAKKRKLSSNETCDPQAKLVKLIPIESILNKHNNRKEESTESHLLQKSIQGKKMIRKPSSVSSTPASSLSRQSSVQEILTEEIKSEPETDDDFSESENLEAKRKYLSALNISEKINDDEKRLRANEIRTRSKTEEKREKFKVVDNLTRIIDDVALNYSAIHEGQELPPKKPERRRSMGAIQEGEIFVKSFAKIQAPKQRARKSFPVPAYIKPNQLGLSKKDASPTAILPKKDVPKSTANIISAKIISSTAVAPTIQSPKTTVSGSTTMSHVILLPPNQTISYNSSLVNPILSVVPPIISTSTTNSTSQPGTQSLLRAKAITPNLRASQNYIPQNEVQNKSSDKQPNNQILNDLLNQPVVNTRESDQSENTENDPNAVSIETETDTPQDDEFNVLNSLLPENVSRAVSNLLLRPPPRLKPKPPGMLSTIFDEGVPSSAGSVTSKINSVAHRMGDYFRGMLIGTLEDLGNSTCPEAKITGLQLEIESLKHRHTVEISEIRKNVCTILKDIQKSIVEDRERIIDDTRAACEAETIKRVELAKSKQWCANCSKEAQFYCCWNTSYCDYPCQQKHWPQHLGKCTQNIEKINNTVTVPNRPTTGQQLILRPAVPPKPGMGRILAKPTKVYMNRATGPPKTFKTLTTTGNHLTVIETTPGNYELVGNGPIAVTGKFLATASNIFQSKFKTTNVVTMTSPSTSSTSGTLDQRISQKTISMSDSTKSTIPATSSTLPVTTEDESD